MKASGHASSPRVFMMDLWATVPYYTAYLSRALLRNGVSVQVGAITYYLDRSCFRDRGLRLDPGCSDVVAQLDLPRSLRRAAKLLESSVNLLALAVRFRVRAPEIVHIQFLPLLRSRLPMDLWFVRYCRSLGARLVLTVHDLMPHDTGDVHREIYRKLYAGVDALICHSETIRGRLLAEFDVPEDRIAVIPHGPFFYDLPRENSRSGKVQRTVLWQGILFPYKGVDLLLDAWQIVEAAEPDLQLRILGTGDPALLQTLQDRAKTLGLLRVSFDFRFCSAEELVSAYREAEMVVYPYRAITTSGALATGLALEKAIVASDLPVFRELLTDGKNALLVDPHSAPELAGAILRLAADPELAEHLRAEVSAMHFGDQSWAEIAAATAQVYRRVLACHSEATA